MHVSRWLRAALAAVGVLLVSSWANASPGGERTKVTFNSHAYLSHVRYLASDELEGRQPGTEGIEKAARYIAEQFQREGILPGGEGGGYFQEFDAGTRKVLAESRATLSIHGLDQTFAYGKDWVAMPFTYPEDVSDLPLAFCGYGISAQEHGYDDYKDFDASGKALLVFRYEPKAEDENADFGGKNTSSHALFVTKARTAARHGAKALLIVNPPNRDPDKDELYAWSDGDARMSYDVPMVHVSRAVAGAILAKAGLPDLATLCTKAGEQGGASQDLAGLKLALRQGIEKKPTLTRNVVGLLKGQVEDEFIVVGAHYDHVGRIPPRGRRGGEAEIHNGADDNASGTAGVIELAGALAAGPKPRRSILFMLFSAEEMGLLGSAHYVNHPTVPLDKIKAMVNFDMIGRLRPEKFEVYGTTTGQGLAEIVKEAAHNADLPYSAPATRRGYFYASDQASFYDKKIPVLFCFTGTHEQYHMPEDDVDLINVEGAMKILQMGYEIVYRLADMDQGPEFDPGAPASREADDEAEAAAPPALPTVRLGIVPDLSDSAAGLRVQAVAPGESAETAGMKAGDRIVRIGVAAIASLDDYLKAMSQHKPGDEVEVVVQRDGGEVTLKAKLGASPARP